jgi:RNA polymerase II elongation factor ELL
MPSLSEAERTSMARQARFAYNDMKIPDSDPVWEHVRYRKTNSSGSPTPQPSATKPAAASLPAKVDPPTKRAGGILSTDTKEKNVKPKTKVDISSIKDEGMRSSKVGASAGTRVQEKVVPVHRDDGPSTSSKVGGARKSLDLQARPERSSEPTSKPPAPTQPESRPAQKVPRGRETPVSSLPPKPAVQPGHTKVIDSSSSRVPKNGENGGTTRKNDQGKDSSRDGRVLSSRPDKPDRPSDSDRDRERERDRDRPRDGRIPKGRDSREDFDSDRDRTVRTVKKQRDSREDFVDSDRDRTRVGRIPKRERDVDSDRDRLRDGRVSKERDVREDVVDSGRDRNRDGRIPKKRRQSRDDYEDTDGERGGRRYADGRIPRNKAGEDSDRKAVQKQRDWERGKGKDRSPVEDDRSGSLKRKKPIRDLEDEGMSQAGPQKKGKVSPAPIPSSSRQSRPDLDLSLPKKPDLGPPTHPTLPRQKFKKESSPLPPRAVLPARPITAPPASSAQAQSNSHRHVSSSKLRRKSPIYTSSEDEGEIREDLPRGVVVAPRGSSNSARGFESKPAHAPLAPSALPPPRLPPADVAGLRSRYQKRWQEYIVVYSSLAAERAKTEALLKQEIETDSDWDVDLLDAEELSKLTMKHQTLRADLMEMQRVWTGSVDVSC